jgi:translation initiation factor 3 subunit C
MVFNLMPYLLEFDKLTRLVQRQNTLSGSTAETVPPVYFHVLVTLEKALSEEKEKDSKKKMEAAKARALNTMRQKLRKTLKEYEVEYKAYTEDVVAYTAKFSALMQPEIAPKPKKARKPELPNVDENDGFATVGKGGKTYGLGAGDIYKSLAAIQEARGKKVGWLTWCKMLAYHPPVEHRS